jgi:hypothetical protein
MKKHLDPGSGDCCGSGSAFLHKSQAFIFNLRTVSENIQYPATKLSVDNNNGTCKRSVSRYGYFFLKVYKIKSV